MILDTQYFSLRSDSYRLNQTFPPRGQQRAADYVWSMDFPNVVHTLEAIVPVSYKWSWQMHNP